MIKEILKNIGFDRVEEIPTAEIPFDTSLLQLCEMNSCGAYGKNYTCPPHIGKIEELVEKALSYEKAVVFQKVYFLEDSFDFEGMVKGKEDFKKRVFEIYDALSDFSEKFLVLGAGGCGLCETCGAIDGTPCRFPQKATASLESYGIFVSQLAGKCGMNYINGQNTVTYFGAILF